MLVFDENWEAHQEKATYSLTSPCEVTLKVSCVKEVTVYGVRADQTRVPLRSGTEVRFRAKLIDFEELHVIAAKGTEFGSSFTLVDRQAGDPLNDENPPAVPMPNTSNLLLQMKAAMREANRYNRPPSFDPQDTNVFDDRYVIDDDDDDFEEEIFEKVQKQKREKKAKAEADKAAKATPDPADPPVKPPAAQGASTDEISVPKAAAE